VGLPGAFERVEIMSSQFSGRSVLRQLSLQLLKEYFQHHGWLTDVAWDQLGDKYIEPVYQAWQKMDDGPREQVQVLMQDLYDLRNPAAIATMADELSFNANHRMQEFTQVEGHANKALWVYLKEPAIFERSAMLARVVALSRGRYWEKRNTLPHTPIEVTDDMKTALADRLTEYYSKTQGRGKYCHIEHYKRANGTDYFFAYLDDYPDHCTEFDDGGQLVKRTQRGAFDLVLAYCANDGTLEMYVQGPAKMRDPIQVAFCESVLNINIDPSPPKQPAYDLSVLLDPTFAFETDPADGIAEVRVRALRIEPEAAFGRSIHLRSAPKFNANDIQFMLQNYLNLERLSRHQIRATHATITITFASDGQSKPKTLTFDVGTPSTCNLKSKPDDMRELGERYLKRWGITR
jgi:hypothetical protein